MTQEEKQLLLKDLCARLPYGVKVHIHDLNVDDYDRNLVPEDISLFEIHRIGIKPYLRPMSSMTDEEWKVLDSMCNGVEMMSRLTGLKMFDKAFDWLNVHHFDYRGLIEKGLALQATEGMYGEKHEKPVEPKRIPATIEEAFDILDDVLTEEDKEYLVENGAISAHFSLGMWIRNEWKLWEPVDSDIKTYLKKEGYEHPDDMSNYIIEEFIKYLNNKL